MSENSEILKIEMAKITADLQRSLSNYRNTLTYLLGDAPIESLCLPKQLEKLLINDGCLRVYDLFDRDFTKIKGLGVTRIRDLTSRLNQFFSMS